MKALQKTAYKILAKTGYLFIGAARKFYRPPVEKKHSDWVADRGDTTLLLDYNLNEHATVFDVGGYEGQWASDIYAKYNCTIHVFEPVQQFAKNITKRFEKNNKIIVHDLGLGKTTTTTQITLANDASSVYTTGTNNETIKLVDIDAFVKQNNITTIDLITINIEGGEYELLEQIIETDLIKNITDIQVQFHTVVPQAEQKRLALQKKLEATHKLTYNYPFIWENWTRKE